MAAKGAVTFSLPNWKRKFHVVPVGPYAVEIAAGRSKKAEVGDDAGVSIATDLRCDHGALAEPSMADRQSRLRVREITLDEGEFDGSHRAARNPGNDNSSGSAAPGKARSGSGCTI